MIQSENHPLLDAVAFTTTFNVPLGQIPVPDAVRRLFDLEADAPMPEAEGIKLAVRDLLRHGGFKPAGRNKPASEYLIKAVETGWLSPDKGINAAVDTLNAVSLHSGLPISVIDLDKAEGPFRVGICGPETSYVFNPAGQELKLDGLLALHDAQGPCANSVKDCQRTKTHDGTMRTLSIVWGTTALPGRAAQAAEWNRALLEALGGRTESLPVGGAACGV
jgi:DNA/RNA-binding domain of Phe-tRNA-synthetase-like protein